MGLDASIYTCPMGQVGQEKKVRRLQYWRSNKALHALMQELYSQRTGPNKRLNNVSMLLDEQDLAGLELVVRESRGRYDGYERGSALKAIRKARLCIAHGDAIYYRADY